MRKRTWIWILLLAGFNGGGSVLAAEFAQDISMRRFIVKAPSAPDTESRRLWELLPEFLGLRQKELQVRSFAIVVSVSQYDNWTTLRSASLDGERMRDFLIDKQAFDEVVFLGEQDATAANVRYFMEDYFPWRIDDEAERGHIVRFLFFYSGHGDSRSFGEGRKRGYLIMRDERVGGYGLSVGMEEIEKWVTNLDKARHLLFLLNACFSGLAGEEAFELPQAAQLRNLWERHGGHLITAGTSGQLAIGQEKRWGGSLFTWAVIRGITGSADESGNRDGIVTSYELYSYVEPLVASESKENQTPLISRLTSADEAGQFIFLTKGLSEAMPRALEAGNPSTGNIEQFGGVSLIDASAAVSLAIAGEERYVRGELGDALDFFRRSYLLMPTSAALARVGDVYFELKEWDDAIAALVEAYRLDPTWSGPPYTAARAYYENGDVATAKKYMAISCDLGFDAACESLHRLEKQ